MSFYWRFFNFLVRRVVASVFVVGGCIITAADAPALLPGGTILVNGVSTDDLIVRLVSVGMPLLMAILGLALYRAKPFVPPGFSDE